MSKRRRWLGGHPGVSDLLSGLRMTPLALYLAWSDTVARYRRSVLGPFWLTLGTAIGVGGLGWLWSELLHVDRRSFVPSLTAGLIIWQLISSVLTDGSTCFVGAGNIIRNVKLPYSIHPLQVLLRHVISFLHNIVVFVLVVLLLDIPVRIETLLVLPAFLLLLVNLYWIALALGIIGARFRDVEYALGAVIPLLFFVSPVLYRAEYLPAQAKIVWLNPFSHLIELVRAPLLGTVPPLFVIATCVAMAIAGWLFTLYLFDKRHARIAFWV